MRGIIKTGVSRTEAFFENRGVRSVPGQPYIYILVSRVLFRAGVSSAIGCRRTHAAADGTIRIKNDFNLKDVTNTNKNDIINVRRTRHSAGTFRISVENIKQR